MVEDLNAKKEKLKAELDKLKHEFKIELPKKIAHARAYGDLKENAEYHAARERQSWVQALISQLTEQMSALNDLSSAKIPDDRIAYGSTVTVVDPDDEDESVTFTMVSPNEVNPAEGKISLSSPIGSALANHKPGDIVEVTIPAGKRSYKVVKVITLNGTVLE
jgi:transcription elongation factor GreA